MASQALIFSSFTPKLASFNSRSTTPPQLVLPKSPPALNHYSPSLPMPSLHLKPFNFNSDFKCQVVTKRQISFKSVDDGASSETVIPDYVTSLGKYAVEEASRYWPQKIAFTSVTKYTEEEASEGWTYTLWIAGTEGDKEKNFKAEVLVFFPQVPQELKSVVLDASSA